MPARPLSPEEIEEVKNLVAECDLHPHRLLELLAELIRRRVFDGIACRFRISPKLRAIYEENVPPRASTREWYEAGAEDAIEHELHKPEPVRPPRCW